MRWPLHEEQRKMGHINHLLCRSNVRRIPTLSFLYENSPSCGKKVGSLLCNELLKGDDFIVDFDLSNIRCSSPDFNPVLPGAAGEGDVLS